MDQRMKVILNPAAARGYGAKVAPQLRRFLEVEKLDFELVTTDRPGHAAELAKQAVDNGFKIVVAVGGDGTVNEVVNGLIAASEGEVAGTLGIIPIGSGSDFAYAVGVPPDLRGACHRLVHGQTRLVDVGRVTLPDGTSRYFDNTVGIGFDGIVALESRNVRWLHGFVLYLWTVLRTIIFYNLAPVMRVEYDGETITQPTLMLVVANGRREGGGFLVTPQAKLDDGLFDLCLARGINRLQILQLLPHVMKGTHIDKEPVTMAQARYVRVTSETKLVAHMDGEILCTDAHRLEFEILPQRLQVLC